MKQKILYWGEGETSLEKQLEKLIEQGNTIVCVVPTEYDKMLTRIDISRALIIYTESQFGKGR